MRPKKYLIIYLAKCSNTPTGWSHPHLELILFIKLLQEIWHHLGTRCCSWLRRWTSQFLAGRFWLSHCFLAFLTLAGWRRSVHKCSLPELQIQIWQNIQANSRRGIINSEMLGFAICVRPKLVLQLVQSARRISPLSPRMDRSYLEPPGTLTLFEMCDEIQTTKYLVRIDLATISIAG
jgi:hypothetical protein